MRPGSRLPGVGLAACERALSRLERLGDVAGAPPDQRHRILHAPLRADHREASEAQRALIAERLDGLGRESGHGPPTRSAGTTIVTYTLDRLAAARESLEPVAARFEALRVGLDLEAFTPLEQAFLSRIVSYFPRLAPLQSWDLTLTVADESEQEWGAPSGLLATRPLALALDAAHLERLRTAEPAWVARDLATVHADLGRAADAVERDFARLPEAD